MKRTIFTTALTLILIFSLCGSVFAGEINNEIGNVNVERGYLDESSGSQVIMSNGLTANITYPTWGYIRITFRNSTNSTITDTATITDVQSGGAVISGPFNISVPAKGTKTYDAYIGTYIDGWVKTVYHGEFYFAI